MRQHWISCQFTNKGDIVNQLLWENSNNISVYSSISANFQLFSFLRTSLKADYSRLYRRWIGCRGKTVRKFKEVKLRSQIWRIKWTLQKIKKKKKFQIGFDSSVRVLKNKLARGKSYFSTPKCVAIVIAPVLNINQLVF